MLKKISVLVSVFGLVVPLLAAAISLDQAVVTGKRYLAKTYSADVVTVRSIENDNGGVQVAKQPDGWKIWYYPVQSQKTKAHIVLVHDDGSAEEFNKEIFARIDQGKAIEEFKKYLFAKGIAPKSVNVRARFGGYIGNGSYSRREISIMGSETALRKAVGSNPVYLVDAYFESSKNKPVTYVNYTGIVDGMNGAVVGHAKTFTCSFGTIINEDVATELVRQQRATTNLKTYLNKCFWVVPNVNGISQVSDDGSIHFSQPDTIQAGAETPQVTPRPVKRTFFQWLFNK